ncbi:dihydrodipicolinate synthase family protein [Alkalicoccobacillus gibsonii]|uniref:dihydrodipicolinate synthase family protein n=1 Tax=Alkalicoccobacillus gibsonii TaxID=79881 RepID=UPI003510EE91
MDYKTFAKRLETISAIPITAFHDDLSVNWDGVKENIDFLMENKLEVVVPCGNTSEFYALSMDEAKEETKRVVEYVNGRALVVAGVGYAVPTAVELGNFAKEACADAIMIHMPVHPYITSKGAANYFRSIIEQVDLPAIVYFKDPNVSDDVLKELAPLDKLVGVKYAINDLPRFTKLVREVPASHNVAWICGTAEKWAPYYWNAGAVGFTSGLVNILPSKSFELLEALRANNWEAAWDVWEHVLPFEDLRAKYNNGNNVVVIKEAMKAVGLTAGKTREPVAALNESDHAEVEALLETWGLKTTQNS